MKNKSCKFYVWLVFLCGMPGIPAVFADGSRVQGAGDIASEEETQQNNRDHQDDPVGSDVVEDVGEKCLNDNVGDVEKCFLNDNVDDVEATTSGGGDVEKKQELSVNYQQPYIYPIQKYDLKLLACAIFLGLGYGAYRLLYKKTSDESRVLVPPFLLTARKGGLLKSPEKSDGSKKRSLKGMKKGTSSQEKLPGKRSQKTSPQEKKERIRKSKVIVSKSEL